MEAQKHPQRSSLRPLETQILWWVLSRVFAHLPQMLQAVNHCNAVFDEHNVLKRPFFGPRALD